MKLKEKDHQERKADEGFASLDARHVALASNDEVVNFIPEKDADKDRLEINIIDATDEYQTVEIIYGDKKKRKRITRFLPKNLANNIFQIAATKPSPSLQVGATNLSNLSHGLQTNGLFLQEKFLRILSKVGQVSEIKTPEKIWDSSERITTADKAILVALVNRLRPESERLDRTIISLRSAEIPNQESFKKFIFEVVDLVKNPQKLMKVLLGDLSEKLSEDKKDSFVKCLQGIISETDDSIKSQQIKILQKIAGEIQGQQQTLRSSF